MLHAQAFIQQGVHYLPHYFTVPLNYNDVAQGQLTLFAREVRLVGDELSDKPWLVYFQGGPGFPAQRPNVTAVG